jgi:hypothetical protein
MHCDAFSRGFDGALAERAPEPPHAASANTQQTPANVAQTNLIAPEL